MKVYINPAIGTLLLLGWYGWGKKDAWIKKAACVNSWVTKERSAIVDVDERKTKD